MFTVQRRLPGAQGANGCWGDQGVWESDTAQGAVQAAVEATGDPGYVESGTYWRAAPAVEWSVFVPRMKRTAVVSVSVIEAQP